MIRSAIATSILLAVACAATSAQTCDSDQRCRVTVTLTNNQIKGLPNTPVPIIAAPGAGKILVVSAAVARADLVALYTGIDSDSYVLLGYNGWSGDASSALPASQMLGLTTDDMTGILGPPQFPSGFPGQVLIGSPLTLGQMENVGISVAAFNGADFAGGHANNELRLTVFYTIVDVP